MGCVSSTEKKKLSSKLKIGSYYFRYTFDQNFLNIQCQYIKNSQICYDNFYDDNSLPEDIYVHIKSAKQLGQAIKKNEKYLQIRKNSLLIKMKDKQLSLSLKYTDDEPIILQNNQKGTITVKQQEKSKNPFNSIVKVMVQCLNLKIQGSGVIIERNTVLTVAHNVYNRARNIQAQSIYIQVQSKDGLKKIKVKKHYFSNKYRVNGLDDLHQYDLAFLQLQQNQLITSQNILPVQFNEIDMNTSFRIMGFSQILDKNQGQNNLYSFSCKKPIKLLQHFIYYDKTTACGISGGAIIIQDKDGVCKLIGLHQGFHISLSRGLLLQKKSQNSHQVLEKLSQFNPNLKNIFSSSINSQKYIKSSQNRSKEENNVILRLNQAKKKFQNQDYERAQQIIQSIKDQYGFSLTKVKYAEITHQLAKVKAIKAQLKLALNEKNGIPISNEDIQKEYEIPLKYFQQSFQIKKNRVGEVDRKIIGQSLYQIIKIQRKLKKYQEALKSLKYIHKQYQKTQMQNKVEYFDVLFQLSQVCSILDKYQDSFNYLQLCEKNLRQKQSSELKQGHYLKIILLINKAFEKILLQYQKQKIYNKQILYQHLKCLQKGKQYADKNKKTQNLQYLLIIAKLGYSYDKNTNYMNSKKLYQAFTELYQKHSYQNQTSFIQNSQNIQYKLLFQEVNSCYMKVLFNLLLIYYQGRKQYNKLQSTFVKLISMLEKKYTMNLQEYVKAYLIYAKALVLQERYNQADKQLNELKKFCQMNLQSNKQYLLQIERVKKQVFTKRNSKGY